MLLDDNLRWHVGYKALLIGKENNWVVTHSNSSNMWQETSNLCSNTFKSKCGILLSC